jgi:hypothetical protein
MIMDGAKGGVVTSSAGSITYKARAGAAATSASGAITDIGPTGAPS